MQMFSLGRLISGGQTGVDRTALDVALALGIPVAGWCPAGRRSEAGPIPDRYPLRETPLPAYPMRTRLNVRDSDATLVFSRGTPRGGTALTVELAIRLRRPFLVIDLAEFDDKQAAEQLAQWLARVCPEILNVAGPRGSEDPELPPRVGRVLRLVLQPYVPGTRTSDGIPLWPPKRPFTPDLFGADL